MSKNSDQNDDRGGRRKAKRQGLSRTKQVDAVKGQNGPIGSDASVSIETLFRMAPLACTLSAAILGQTLAMLRKNKNMTQEDMANAMGISISSWGRIEKGESDMSVIELSTAAEIFGTTPGQILDASKAGENEAELQGVRVVVGAGSDSDLARLFEESGASGGGTWPGMAVIPVKGTFLGGFIGAAVAAALNRGRDRDFVIPPEANQTYKLNC